MRKKVKGVFVFVVFLTVSCLLLPAIPGLSADGAETTPEVEPETMQEGGILLDDISGRFLITLYPARVIPEEGGEWIVYRLSVENRTEEVYHGFRALVSFNPELDPYLLTGALHFQTEEMELAKRSDPALEPGLSKGFDFTIQQSLQRSEIMREMELDRQEILVLGQSLSITLSWLGGEEKHDLRTVVIDETQQPAPVD